MAERFLGSLKRQRTDDHLYATKEEAKQHVIDHINTFYNRRRKHSYPGRSSPSEFETLAEIA